MGLIGLKWMSLDSFLHANTYLEKLKVIYSYWVRMVKYGWNL